MSFRNNLHIKGAAVWHNFQDDLGYFVFDLLSGTHLPIEYDEDTCQWYFICQDSRSRKWNTINTVPQSYNLGRQSIHTSHITAAEVAPEGITFRTYGEPDQDQNKSSNVQSSTITDNIHCSAMCHEPRYWSAMDWYRVTLLQRKRAQDTSLWFPYRFRAGRTAGNSHGHSLVQSPECGNEFNQAWESCTTTGWSGDHITQEKWYDFQGN